MTTLTPGTTLAAVEAMQTQETFTRAQAAYLIALAYETGRRQRLAEGLAETTACWAEHPTPQQVREQRVADRLAAMERYSGPPTYQGGPVDWDTGRPLRGPEVSA